MCFSAPKTPKPPAPVVPPQPPKQVSEEDRLRKDEDRRRRALLRGMGGTNNQTSGLLGPSSITGSPLRTGNG